MNRYFIELSYKGTNFHGWQRQPNAISVQEVIEQGLSKILRTPIEIQGSSRTDTGVHAAQQFAHFETDEPIKDFGKLIYGLNSLLPKDVAIIDIHAVAADAHSRFDATHRRYLYRILRKKNPFWVGLAYKYITPLDVNLMNEACEIMKHYTDFQSFSKYHTDVKTFNCTISKAYWEETEDLLIFHVEANRFLRGMVRAIVGTMLDVGIGKVTLAGFEEILKAKDRKYAGNAAPAEGLTLVEVGYPDGYF
jgi:tRNA pseudouridine38-40 synthase